MKLSYLFITAIIILSFKSHPHQLKDETSYRVKANFLAYQTAMGKGKGIIFRLTISNSNLKTDFTIDSFYIHNKSLPFVIKKIKNGLTLESNYLVSKPEPSLSSDTKKTENLNPTNDVIIDKHQFAPSWIIINHQGKTNKILINKFDEIKESH
jgi:hypothetical protein